MSFTRTIVFTPAFDKRNIDPRRNYGIHGVEMRWYLKGPCGVIQFVVYTNWQLPHVNEERDERTVSHEYAHLLCRPMASDLGYHSPFPMYDCQSLTTESCELLEGKPCYYDGSSLAADDVLDLLIREGGEAVWARLEKEYVERFPEVQK